MARPLREVLEDPEVVRDLQQHPATFRFSEGASLVVSAVHWPPHIEVEEDGDGRLAVAGPVANVLNILAHSFNFTYRIVTPDDGSWGATLPNGTWSGMVGQVSRQEVDVALGPFGITESRAKIVDFTRSFYFDDRSILVSKGVPEVDPWGFLFPLASTVWAALLAVLVVSWLAIVVLSHFPRDSGRFRWILDLLLLHLRIILHQDITMKLSGVRERLVVGGWLLVAMMVTWSYTGNLVSLLAVRHIPQPIQTIRHLVDDAGATVIMEPNTIVTDTISRIKSGDLKELNDLRFVGRVRYQHAKTFPTALDTLVRRQRHVIIGTSLSSELLIADVFDKTGG
ncbi:probable glutamate receptor [Panulirus ornatus]|uniref:probable glutamate receptor n=1 Tax=Panulirus ornatus TaxID=150431 RepID=UPI003A874C32